MSTRRLPNLMLLELPVPGVERLLDSRHTFRAPVTDDKKSAHQR
jgi:hypothetical protein